MYKEFFGLDDIPFTLTPDPRFIVFTPSYNEVLASLYYGLENAKGLIVLTGEVGTGKTTALRWILRRLDSSVLAAYVFNPRLSIDEFYQHVTQMLGIKEWTNKSELLDIMGKVLEERHRRGLRTVIIIDEAHELSDYVLEEIRLLLNFESDNAKHLQIVLTGQPELRDRLNQQNLRQLKQRVALRCNMHSFPTVEEVDRYISERLLIAGSNQPNVFTPEAVDFIFQCSEGIPRNINNICDNAMLAAYSAGEPLIGRKIIEEVAENLDMLPRKDVLHAAEKSLDVQTSHVLRSAANEEMIDGQARHEATKPRVFKPVDGNGFSNGNGNGNGHSHAKPNGNGFANGNGHSNGNGHPNGNGNGQKHLDDDVTLEIDDFVASFNRF
ncbi:MAG: AAA family ATPase [Acidobacteria bacterium]|nr:AAA family ATPase [Acidobacteriota bacterium]